MKCKMCKYRQDIGNTKETGSAICTRQNVYIPVNYNDVCHIIPQKRELVCSDCARFGIDMGCFTAKEDDRVNHNGKICSGFVDVKEQEFMEILMFWRVQSLYDRSKIEKMIEEFENFYKDIMEQGIIPEENDK